MHTQNLQDLGFQVNHQTPSVPRYIEVGFVTREFDMYSLRWGDGFDPHRVLTDFFSESTLEEGGGNVSGYQDDDYEEMLSTQRNQSNVDERQQTVFDMQEKVITDEHVITPVFVQNRKMPLWTDRWQNAVSQPENGLESYWNFINIEPTSQNDDAELTYAQAEPLSHINPVNPERGRVERGMIRIVYDRLMRVPADGGPPVPSAAESVERIEDTVVEAVLRDDLVFHDGEAVDAEDVKFSYEYMGEHNPGFASTWNEIDEVERVDDRTIRFHLSGVFAPFENVGLAGRTPVILPKHIWENVPEDVDASTPAEWRNPDPVGSGPAVVEDFIIDEQTFLSPHEDYYEDVAWDSAVRVQGADQRSIVRQLEQEQLDMINHDIPVNDMNRLPQEYDNIELFDALMTSLHYNTYNMRPERTELFTDSRVRRAFGHALSRQDTLEVAGGGFGQPIVTCFSPGLKTWYKEDADPAEFDLEAARSLLTDAGFEWDTDGVIHYPPGGM